MASIYSLKNIEHRLGNDFCLEVPLLELDSGKIYVINGINGSGKTTLLRLLALGLKPQQGMVCFSGEQIEAKVQISLRRKIALVEQSPYLFHGSVGGNLALGLKIRRISKPEQDQRISVALELVGLPEFAQRAVKELSGGEVQRIALARALVLHPNVLLLDEPTANIDSASVAEFEGLLRRLVAGGMTVVMATHDLEQVERLGGELIQIENGVVGCCVG